MQVVSGKVIVRAPLRIKESYIEDLLTNKTAWIEEKITQQLSAQTDQNQLCVGGQMWFDGRLYPLDISYGNKHTITLDNTSIQLVLKVTQDINPNTVNSLIKKRLEVWLKKQAEAYLIARSQHYSFIMSLSPNIITIRQYKTRWGSCNSLGNVQFNYLLMMAPKWVIDYVVVHELCHLQHLNHSCAFWELVELYCPNYAVAKQWLKKHQNQLQWRL